MVIIKMLGFKTNTEEQEKKDFEYFFARQCVKIISDEAIESFEEDILNKKVIKIKKISATQYGGEQDYLSLGEFVKRYLVFSQRNGSLCNEAECPIETVLEHLITNDFPDFVLKLIFDVQSIRQKEKNEVQQKAIELKNKLILPHGETNKD